MCWCRPEIRTPNCGRMMCVPPDADHQHVTRVSLSPMHRISRKDRAQERVSLWHSDKVTRAEQAADPMPFLKVRSTGMSFPASSPVTRAVQTSAFDWAALQRLRKGFVAKDMK